MPCASSAQRAGCDRAFSPGGGVGGAPVVYAVRVNPATQSALDIADAAAGVAVHVTSTDYGAQTLQNTVAIANATNAGAGSVPAGAKKVTVGQIGQTAIVGDNIGYGLLSLTYHGAGTASYAVTTTGITVTGSGAGETSTFAFASYPTLGALAAAITAQASGMWTCTVVAATNASPTSPAVVGASSPSGILDVVATVSLTIGVAAIVTGVAQAIVDWLNGAADPYWTALRGASGKPPANVAATAGTGGTDGTLANQDWQDAVNALQSVDTALVVVMSDSAAVHTIVDSHCAYMAAQGKMERIQIAGGLAGESDAQVVARAQAINSKRTALYYPGIKDFDRITGVLTTYPPYYVAAMVAGLAAGGAENLALTNRAVRCQALETRSSGNGGAFVQADYDTLLQAGVGGIQYKPTRGYIITQSIMTWLQDNLVDNREMSVRRAVDRIQRSVRERLEDMIANNGSPVFLARVESETRGVLVQFVQSGWLVGDSTNPPIRQVSASIVTGQPDTTYVSYTVAVGQPQNYILVTQHIVPYAGSVAA
jgi:hypothetical protein